MILSDIFCFDSSITFQRNTRSIKSKYFALLFIEIIDGERLWVIHHKLKERKRWRNLL